MEMVLTDLIYLFSFVETARKFITALFLFNLKVHLLKMFVEEPVYVQLTSFSQTLLIGNFSI